MSIFDRSPLRQGRGGSRRPRRSPDRLGRAGRQRWGAAITSAEWVQAIVACIVTAAGVYAVPNVNPDPEV